jgi:signal transduction histidine kinase
MFQALLGALVVLTTVYLGQGLPWDHAIAAAAIVVVPGSALGWWTWRRVSRSPQLEGNFFTIKRHAIGALLYSVLWTAMIFALAYLVHPEAALGFLRNAAPWQFIGGLVVYSAIAAAAHAARARELLKQQELAAATAELRALRAQLNPHFLFNTLHSLTQLAHEDPDATERALEQFAQLMRYVLNAGRDHAAGTSLEEEIVFVRNYLALEHMRLGDRLRVVEEIEPDALELQVPTLVLQPLVENAVRHGISPRRAGGTIQLRAWIRGDRLLLKVADDGAGAAAAACEAGNGLGLKAVRRQLDAHFPGAAKMEVASTPGGGFAVEIELPARVAGGI